MKSKRAITVIGFLYTFSTLLLNLYTWIKSITCSYCAPYKVHNSQSF